MLSLTYPTAVQCRRLVEEVAAALQLTTQVVVDVVAPRVAQLCIEGQTTVAQSGEDVTIEIGVGVADDNLVPIVDGRVIVLIDKDDVAGTEVAAAARSQHIIESCGLSFGSSGIDTSRAVAIEDASRTSYGCQHLAAVKLRGEITVGKRGNAVAVSGCREPCLPRPIAGSQQFDVQTDVGSHILQSSLVAPIVVLSRQFRKALQGEQIRGKALKNIQRQTKTIVPGHQVHTRTQSARGFPLQGIVSDSIKAQSYGVTEIFT